MKKLLAILLIIVLAFSVAIGCDDSKAADIIRIGAMDGPTMMGLGKLNDDNDKSENAKKYSVSKVGTADLITAGLANKTFDVATVPANVASILFNAKDIDIQVAATNTMNVLFVVTKGVTINSLADLAGKTIYSPGKGTIPEFVFRHILAKNSLEINETTGVNLQFKSAGTEIVAGFVANTISIALLPQPAATLAIQKGGASYALDLKEEWAKIEGHVDAPVVTGVLVVRKEFLAKNKKRFDAFLSEYKSSIEFMSNTENIDTAAQFVVDMGILPQLPIAKEALPKCSLAYHEGAELKNLLSKFLTVLFEQDNKSIGGAKPGDEFYYAR